jgi:hypothetical protein
MSELWLGELIHQGSFAEGYQALIIRLDDGRILSLWIEPDEPVEVRLLR